MQAQFANPQAMAAAAIRQFGGDSRLGIGADRDTWLTPRFILSQLGAFDLDPCAASENPGWVGAVRSFSRADDGLTQPWLGRVFLNPPFSNTVPWLVKHAEHGRGISLVPASIESNAWRDIVWKRARAILLLHGRTRFCNPDGSQTTGRPLRPICLIGWTERDAMILRRSALAGVLLRDWNQR